MAMNFQRAGLPQTPDYMTAHMQDAEIRNQMQQAETMRRMGYAGAGASLAEKVPMEKWDALGNAILGKDVVGGASLATPVATDAATGAVASLTPEAAMAAASPFGNAAAGTAGMAPEVAAGLAEAGAGAGGGASGALAALGPVGWLALLGFGLAATDAL